MTLNAPTHEQVKPIRVIFLQKVSKEEDEISTTTRNEAP